MVFRLINGWINISMSCRMNSMTESGFLDSRAAMVEEKLEIRAILM